MIKEYDIVLSETTLPLEADIVLSSPAEPLEFDLFTAITGCKPQDVSSYCKINFRNFDPNLSGSGRYIFKDMVGTKIVEDMDKTYEFVQVADGSAFIKPEEDIIPASFIAPSDHEDVEVVSHGDFIDMRRSGTQADRAAFSAGALVSHRASANSLNRMVQDKGKRVFGYNPNMAVLPKYFGEVVIQTGVLQCQKVAWINTSFGRARWAVLAGTPCVGERDWDWEPPDTFIVGNGEVVPQFIVNALLADFVFSPTYICIRGGGDSAPTWYRATRVVRGGSTVSMTTLTSEITASFRSSGVIPSYYLDPSADGSQPSFPGGALPAVGGKMHSPLDPAGTARNILEGHSQVYLQGSSYY